jgi:glutamate racemase
VRLAVLDWGIGGVGFYARFKARFPAVSVIYLSDTGVTPYGLQSARELRERLDLVVERLGEAGVTRLVVACNAMSTILPRLGDAVPPERRCGVIESALSAILGSGVRRVGVIGGVRTVRSGAYRRPLTAAGVRVAQRIAQPLSALIEAGRVDSPEFRGEVERILRPLAGIDALVLGCTHYTAALESFRTSTTASLIVDPVVETLAREVSAWFAGERMEKGVADDIFCTSGDVAAMIRAARLAFGVEIAGAASVARDLQGLQDLAAATSPA